MAGQHNPPAALDLKVRACKTLTFDHGVESSRPVFRY